MAWETALFRKTRLAVHQNCLALIEAYAELAPLWQRVLLATYVGIGPPVAAWVGGNTRTMWEQADRIIGDLFATSGMSAREVAKSLAEYVSIKRSEQNGLAFDRARKSIYDQSFYPLVTHFTLAFQPSAVARMRFIRRVVESVSLPDARVADLGCGSGAMLCEILKLKPGWLGFGLDISDAAIRYAKRLALHHRVADRINLQTGCITKLPYSSRSLDVVIASEVVEHLPDPENVFKELSRILAPRGLLLVTMPVESHSPAHMHSLSNSHELQYYCKQAGLSVRTLELRWHLTFGDDARHVFVVAQAGPLTEIEEEQQRDYALSLPQMSSAASSGMVSS